MEAKQANSHSHIRLCICMMMHFIKVKAIKSSFCISVLKVVKEAQLAHGLRHNDYQLYRQYCSRRIRRLRKNLKLIQGDRKNFRKKEVTVNLLKEER